MVLHDLDSIYLRENSEKVLDVSWNFSTRYDHQFRVNFLLNKALPEVYDSRAYGFDTVLEALLEFIHSDEVASVEIAYPLLLFLKVSVPLLEFIYERKCVLLRNDMAHLVYGA